MYVCVFVCVHACMRVHVYTRVCVRVCIHTMCFGDMIPSSVDKAVGQLELLCGNNDARVSIRVAS